MPSPIVQYPPASYLPLFCKFLYKYDSLRNYRSVERFEHVKNGYIARIGQIIGGTKRVLLHQTISEMEYFNRTSVNEEVVFITGNAKIELDFIRHIRNSIAHGLLKKSGKYFIIEDYTNQSRRNLSAYGKIKTTKIKELLETYIN